MKFVKSVLKVLPEIMVLLSSMSYIIIRLVADMNKVLGLIVSIYQRLHYLWWYSFFYIEVKKEWINLK